MMDDTKRCTDNLDKALGYVDEIIRENRRKLAKQIIKDVFSKFGQFSLGHSFTIKCYVTEKPDIRFCIERGSDCPKKRTMTAFIVMMPLGEIHVVDTGKPYLRPLNKTNFYEISASNVLELSYDKLWEHIKNSFCSKIKQFYLNSPLCN
jgi:hypothetical protein